MNHRKELIQTIPLDEEQELNSVKYKRSIVVVPVKQKRHDT